MREYNENKSFLNHDFEENHYFYEPKNSFSIAIMERARKVFRAIAMKLLERRSIIQMSNFIVGPDAGIFPFESRVEASLHFTMLCEMARAPFPPFYDDEVSLALSHKQQLQHRRA